jgi:creatinine amidohydrolase
MQLLELKWPDVQALAKDTPVVVPVAALEQHGLHLPLFTDSLLLGEVVRRVEAQLKTQIIFSPLMWLGNSDHHLDFPGTLSAPPRTYLDLIGGLTDNLLRHGFRRIVFLNGHGGNDVPGRQALFEVRQRQRERVDLLLLWATYWSLAKEGRTWPAGLVQSNMGHACEWETSMILRLAPQLVGDFRQLPAVPQTESFSPGWRAWITRERTEPGHIGYPSAASAEKGEWLLTTFANDAVRLLERVAAWDGRSWDA